jgi:hypothetical protein
MEKSMATGRGRIRDYIEYIGALIENDKNDHVFGPGGHLLVI